MKTKQTSQEWEDVNLAWNASEYDGVTNIRYNDGLVMHSLGFPTHLLLEEQVWRGTCLVMHTIKIGICIFET